MLQNLIHQLKWEFASAYPYLYGGIISYHSNHSVTLKHSLLPSGVTLAQWDSPRSNHSVTAPLPLLERQHSYTILCQFQTVPEQSAYLKIECYDKFDQLIQHTIAKPQEAIPLTLPSNTHSYRFKLMSSGCSELHFESILISADSLPHYSVDRFWIEKPSKWADNEPLYICFAEPDKHCLPPLSFGRYCQPRLKNMLSISSSYNQQHYFISQSLEQELKKVVQSFGKTCPQQSIFWIGYGPISNMASLWYHDKIPNSFAVLSEQLLSAEHYHLLLSDISPEITLEHITKLITETNDTCYRYTSVKKTFPSIIPLTNTLRNLSIPAILTRKEPH